MLRKARQLPAPNGLAVALRELRRIEHAVHLDWLQSVELRRRVRTGWARKVRRATRWRGAVFFQPPRGNRGSG